MVYGVLQVLHLVFGLFFALVTVCAIRGLSLHIWNLMGKFPAPATRHVSAEKKTEPTLGAGALPLNQPT
jgi:hypothetical protein